jgi:hypothetical protein
MSIAGSDLSYQLNISYILFNVAWDDYLVHKGRGNAGRQAGTPLKHDSRLYMTYLRNSIITLCNSNLPMPAIIDIWVLELEDNRFCELIDANLRPLLPGESFRVRRISADLVRHLIDYELARPGGDHKSPNNIHEFLMYHVLGTVGEPYVYLPDVDTLFLTGEFIHHNLQLLRSRPGAIAVSFMDRSREIPLRGSVVQIPERMHTVSIFFNVAALHERVDLAKEMALQLDFPTRAGLLKNDATRAFFLKHQHADSLSFLTEQLKQDGDDLLLSAEEGLSLYFEDSALTIGCPHFIHGKYLDLAIHNILVRNFGGRKDVLLRYQWAYNFVTSLPPVTAYCTSGPPA